jgi:hypothetical protein
MTIRHARRVAVLCWVSLLVVGSRPSLASCVVDDQGPCYRYWHTDAVLLGEVRDKVLVSAQTGGSFALGHTYVLRVAVLEAFRGAGPVGSMVAIETSSGECGFDVSVGARVFFYAHRRKDGTLGASSYSRPFEVADDDLDYARSANAGTAVARVYGEVLHRDDPVVDAGSFTSLSNVTVRVRGAGFDATTTTDDEGHYSIRLPGVGRFQVTVVPPPGMADRYPFPSDIEIRNPQECRRAEFHLLTNGRIRGVVVDEATGRPIPNLVLRAGDDLQESKTDRSGAFDIGPLSAGDYTVEAMTGGGIVGLLPGAVTVRSARPTVLRPLVARLSQPLQTVTFDLMGLPGDGWIEIREVSHGLRVGRDDVATFVIARDHTVELYWRRGDGDTTRATVTIDKDVTRVTLSQLTWRPAH